MMENERRASSLPSSIEYGKTIEVNCPMNLEEEVKEETSASQSIDDKGNNASVKNSLNQIEPWNRTTIVNIQEN
jgi:hypothetical protein